jgi:hypothetical protein
VSADLGSFTVYRNFVLRPVNSTSDPYCTLPEWLVFPLRGSTDFFRKRSIVHAASACSRKSLQVRRHLYCHAEGIAAISSWRRTVLGWNLKVAGQASFSHSLSK